MSPVSILSRNDKDEHNSQEDISKIYKIQKCPSRCSTETWNFTNGLTRFSS